MAITNHDRIGKGLNLTRDGLRPFVERELLSAARDGRIPPLAQFLDDMRAHNRDEPLEDVALLINIMVRGWDQIFRQGLGKTDRSYVNELSDVRNKWAHMAPFSSDDTERALDTMNRLLTAVSATEQADEVAQMRQALLRQVYAEQTRSATRRVTTPTIEASSNLRPWRDVITPHRDVASGNYQQAEFAADLWQVHLGEGSPEYRDPVEFFRRTYLTESLSQLLTGAVRRLTGSGGDPVVQLQTNFGGGKTHSMLALYHLFSGADPRQLPGMDDLLAAADVGDLPRVRRVVLVGNKISPGNPSRKPDGTEVRTLWGELAWQLGGREAYDYIAADDERATNPGDALRELFVAYGPSLILIDEWVAYARQLHHERDLPGGTFETQFSFAQALTEAAKLAGNCLLVVSLPASDTSDSPHAQVDDAEVGGTRGREALERLRNVVGRLESSWRPATAEEGFEIVRRRLFEPLPDDAAYRARDLVARQFADFYRAQSSEFPSETRDPGYERRIQAAYPIHPEVFDRLYTDWSTQAKFQRTRGVLRLMAAVIHSLWQNQDASPLILPASIPIDDLRVRDELTRYLPDQWTPIIEKDVDGPHSLPQQIDSEVQNLGRLAATRRVARTIYLGSAPTTKAATRGLEEQRVRLGSVMPGETPAIFGDALRRLTNRATYLYSDGNRYWYDIQPTVTRMAEDRAEQLKREPDTIHLEIERRLKLAVTQRDEFARVHVAPQSSADIQDDFEARLVVLGPQAPHGTGQSEAMVAAQEILERRGSMPRQFRNTLVFLAADRTRLGELDEAVRRYLAWKWILDSSTMNELTQYQQGQARDQLRNAESVVEARLPETYQWLLNPEQKTAQEPVTWQAFRLSGSDPLAVRASKRLRNEDALVVTLGFSVLKNAMDIVPLWNGDHVSVRQLVEYFASYPYLPRLRDPNVLLAAISNGLGQMLWAQETFAWADSFDAETSRYAGLRCGERLTLSDCMDRGLIVKGEVAVRQRDAERAVVADEPTTTLTISEGNGASAPGSVHDGPGASFAPTHSQAPQRARRYYGTVEIDPLRPTSAVGTIADEVISHLAAMVGARVTLTLEINATFPEGASEHVVRTVTENGRTLKFTSHGFEAE